MAAEAIKKGERDIPGGAEHPRGPKFKFKSLLQVCGQMRVVPSCMNIAIVDVGSNNIKLEIHGIESDGSGALLYADKFGARLGHNVFLSHRLEKENKARALDGLGQFSTIIKSFNCKETIALGTAALRETEYKAFVKQVYKETGINIKVISGKEEARLCYLGALAHIPFNDRTFFLIDIGGGSTEISISDHEKMMFVESLRLGTVRLKELFGEDDFAKSRDLINNYVVKVIEPFASEIEKHHYDMGLCTGGTAKNLVEMLAHRVQKDTTENGISVLNTEDLHQLVDDMTQMSPKEISKIKGLDKARSDIIFPGAVLLLSILEKAEIKNSYVIDKGLRDGAVSDYVFRKVNKRIYRHRQSETRLHAIERVSEKFNVEKKHARQCARLATELFDLLADEHKLDVQYKDLIFGAALLHDIGLYIDYSSHHKHSYYLIVNSELLGFSEQEKLIMALVARYHRKGLPKNSHSEYQSLSEESKDIVVKLASILRIADALDRSYKSAVSKIRLLESGKGSVVLGVEGKKLDLELWSVKRKKDFFQKVFDKKLSIEKV